MKRALSSCCGRNPIFGGEVHAMITLRDVATHLETIAPRQLQESYDNSGWIVGDPSQPLVKALICLDCTEAVIEEAIEEGCNLIVAHHPIIFGGLKRLTGANYVERTVMSAIKNDIAIYAIHTNFDNVINGVNQEIGQRLGLKNLRILSPAADKLCKLVTYVPPKDLETVRKAIFEAGAGTIGNYSETAFELKGEGTFKGNSDSNPTSGTAGQLERVEEVRLETIFPKHLQRNVVAALNTAHPYEEVAYDIFPMRNSWAQVGSGAVGELAEPMSESDFLKHVYDVFNLSTIRHTRLKEKSIAKVAICGGSGSFLLPVAKAVQADVFITSDFKYHEFFDAEDQTVIMDIGHYESEQFTIDLIAKLLREKFPKFAFLFTEVNTNPVHYYKG